MKLSYVLFLALILGQTAALASSELNSEIDHFQVDLKPTGSNSTSSPRRTRPVAKAEIPDQDFDGGDIDTSATDTIRSEAPLFYRFEALPMASFSSLDGDNNIVPSGFINASIVNVSGAFLTDLNIGWHKFVIETGAEVLQTGALTGITFTQFGGTPYSSVNDQISLTYAGIPIDIKWMASGEYRSSFYAKAGVMPAFMVRHQYYNPGTYTLQEARFGGYNVFDAIFNVGAGYNLSVSKNLQILVDAGLFQGIVPIVNNYNGFNAGATAGLGLAYLL